MFSARIWEDEGEREGRREGEKKGERRGVVRERRRVEEEERRRRRGGRRRGGAKIASAYIREQTVEMWEGTHYNLLIATCPNQTFFLFPSPQP